MATLQFLESSSHFGAAVRWALNTHQAATFSLDLQRLPMTASTAHSRPHLRAEQPLSSDYSQSLSASSYTDRRFRPWGRHQLFSLPIRRPLSAHYAAASSPSRAASRGWRGTSSHIRASKLGCCDQLYQAIPEGKISRPFHEDLHGGDLEDAPGSRGHSCSPPVRLSQILGKIKFSKHNKFPSFIPSSLFVILSQFQKLSHLSHVPAF